MRHPFKGWRIFVSRMIFQKITIVKKLSVYDWQLFSIVHEGALKLPRDYTILYL